MNDFLMLTFLCLFIAFAIYITFRSESLINDILLHKNVEGKRGIWWGTLSLFFLISHKNQYLNKEDITFLIEYKKIIVLHWVLLIWLILLIIIEQTTSYWSYNQATGADGVKIAVLRKGRIELKIIWAAAHRRTLFATRCRIIKCIYR